MATHRRITFARGTLGRFIKKHGLRMHFLEVPAYMICKVDDKGEEKHFILTFNKRGGGILKIPYSQGSSVEGYPDIEGMMEGLASDIVLADQYDSAESFCEALGIPEEDCLDIFQRLNQRNEDIHKFLGSEAYEELAGLSVQGGYEMEGDSQWRRASTCGR